MEYYADYIIKSSNIILRLGQKYFKTKKKYYSYKSRRKKTSINIYFIIQPFFSP